MKNRKNMFLLVLVSIAVLFMTIGTALAYFTNIRIAHISESTDVTSVTMHTLMFNTGEPLKIIANQQNFGENMESLSDSTYALAMLIAGSDQKEVSYKYDVYLQIDVNDFEYSDYNKTSELIATIIGPNGRELTTIDQLEYKNVGSVRGFDITNKTGKFLIADDYEIKTKTEITHRWNLSVTFNNLNWSQDINLNKKIKGWLVIERVEED